MSRRRFLVHLGGSAAGGWLLARGETGAAATPTPLRIAVLRSSGCPTLDTQPLPAGSLEAALAGLDLRVLDAEALGTRLTPEDVDVVINPYGSAFPKAAWPGLLAYLRAGGHFVNLGGAPFTVPVRGHTAETRQIAYHKRLGITQTFAVDASRVTAWQASESLEWSRPLASGFGCTRAHALYLRLASTKTWPDEDGSEGPREAWVRPLVTGVDAQGWPRAVPVLALDRVSGDFAGGRWAFVTSDRPLPPAALRALVDATGRGPSHFEVRPGLPVVSPAETPRCTVAYERYGPRPRPGNPPTCRIEVTDPAGRIVLRMPVALRGSPRFAAEVPLTKLRGSARPGLYRIEARFDTGEHARTAFFFDAPATARSPTCAQRLTAGARILLRDGVPFPVCGMNAMASDAHRRFLLDPNPDTWDRDFAAMARSGVNMLRTGIWTGWRDLSDALGAPTEGLLRSLDAFWRTARRHDLPVIFTFFAFLPETWGGQNPFLDPAAVAAQRRFVTGIVRRFAAEDGIVWDLINEPSFSSARQLWYCRPNYDAHEETAWAGWLKEQFPSPTDAEREALLQERWRTRPGEALTLPRLEDFAPQRIWEERRPLKAMDYRRFAQAMFRRWVVEMRTAINQSGGSSHLVMVGQDEGGTLERPANPFFGDAADLTSLHAWWFNDDLLWDVLITQLPHRPHLVQEAGMMFYERIDGSAWRNEKQVRDLVERKMAVALGVSGAGVLVWLWNTNPYLPSDNEAAIGVMRPDGSAKPEREAFADMAAFVRSAAPHLRDREPAPALLVFPHSNLFSARNQATEATRRAVRAMHYHCRVAMDVASEYALGEWPVRPPLVVLPSPRVLTEVAWTRLSAWVEAGTVLAASGPLDADEHWRETPRLERLGLRYEAVPVRPSEALRVGETEHLLGFRGDRLERVETAALAGAASTAVQRIAVGRGLVLWSPVPIELADEVAPTVAFYRLALEAAGLAPLFEVEGADAGTLVYPAVYGGAVLYTLISEGSRPLTVQLRDHQSGAQLQVALPAQRSALRLIDRRDGKLRARYDAAPD